MNKEELIALYKLVARQQLVVTSIGSINYSLSGDERIELEARHKVESDILAKLTSNYQRKLNLDY